MITRSGKITTGSATLAVGTYFHRSTERSGSGCHLVSIGR